MLEVFEKLKIEGINLSKEMDTPFSILSIMHDEISRKEVIHSKILKNLLSPDANHGYKNVLIDSFLIEIGVINFNFDSIHNLCLYNEYAVDGRYIDLLITWEEETIKKAVIIENKLNYAVDQINQLNDYYDSISKSYVVEKIVYMPINPYKTAKDTDTRDEVLKKTIDFNIWRLINWLSKSIDEMNNLEQIHHLIAYRDLLKIMYINHYQFMKAEEIQAKLSPEDIIKLIDLASIVNSKDWHNAKYQKLKEKIVNNTVKEPLTNFKGCSGEFYYHPYEYWVELWSYEKHIEFFLCSYAEQPSMRINGISFIPHTQEKGRYYYKPEDQRLFSFAYPTEFEALAETLQTVLQELSEYSEETKTEENLFS